MSATIVSALLSAIHVLTLALGLGAVFARGQALAGTLDAAGWRRVLAADNVWRVAAGLWIASGLMARGSFNAGVRSSGPTCTD